MSTKFHKDWFRLSKVSKRNTQQRDLISLLYFFKIRKVSYELMNPEVYDAIRNSILMLFVN
jgi:hypothetical protein